MKTRKSLNRFLGVVLAVANVGAASAQDSIGAASATNASEKVIPATPVLNPSAVTEASPPAPGSGDKPEVPLSPWAREIQELTQAGVDERVITSYITNSA